MLAVGGTAAYGAIHAAAPLSQIHLTDHVNVVHHTVTPGITETHTQSVDLPQNSTNETHAQEPGFLSGLLSSKTLAADAAHMSATQGGSQMSAAEHAEHMNHGLHMSHTGVDLNDEAMHHDLHSAHAPSSFTPDHPEGAGFAARERKNQGWANRARPDNALRTTAGSPSSFADRVGQRSVSAITPRTTDFTAAVDADRDRLAALVEPAR